MYRIDDDNCVPAFTFNSNPSGTGGNGVGYWPGNTSNNQNPEFYAFGEGDNYGISFRCKGNWFFGFHATAQAPTKIRWYEQETNGMQAVGLQAPASVANTFDITLPDSPGHAGDVLYTPDGYALKFGRPASVLHAGCSFTPGTNPTYLRYDGFTGAITRNGTGDYTLTMSAATADSASFVNVTADGSGTAVISNGSQPSSTTVRARFFDAAGVAVDPSRAFVTVFGAP